MTIENYRKQLDEVDGVILSAFEKRMDIVKNIGEYKKEKDIPVTDTARESVKLEMAKKSVKEEYSAYAESLMKKLMELSKELQNE